MARLLRSLSCQQTGSFFGCNAYLLGPVFLYGEESCLDYCFAGGMNKDGDKSVKYFWLFFGWLFVALGAVGMVLPLLPTVPFLLLAAICFSRGSPRLYAWLIDHAHLGPPIRQWKKHGAISTRVKFITMGVIAGSIALSFVYGVPTYALVIQLVVLTGVSTFVLTRPAPPEEQDQSA